MHAVFANDFSPAIIQMYNASASVVAAGYGVMRLPSVAQTFPDAANPHAAVSYIKGITYATASISAHQFSFVGVAVESIAPSTYGAVCIGGPCRVRIGISASYSAGCPLGIDPATAGSFVEIVIESTADAFAVPLMNISATVDVAIGDFIDAFIEPVKVAGAQGFYL
jgi:hypothetical protein